MTTNTATSIPLLIPDRSLAWQNDEALIEMVMHQQGWNFEPGLPAEYFHSRFREHTAWTWNHTRPALPADPENLTRVIDVGSGLSALDIGLHCLNTSTEFYLVDRDIVNYGSVGLFYNNTTNPDNFYNSWAVVDDLLANSPGVDAGKFTKLAPDDSWPTEVDLVVSHQSWCWHYPKERYWSKLLSSLKIGGTLILDVLNQPDRDIVAEISESLGSAATCLEIHFTPEDHPFYGQFTLKDQLRTEGFPYTDKSHGGYYYWTRTR